MCTEASFLSYNDVNHLSDLLISSQIRYKQM